MFPHHQELKLAKLFTWQEKFQPNHMNKISFQKKAIETLALALSLSKIWILLNVRTVTF